ncbi:MAG: hypothetical protein WD512_02225, partial [Candidatus Paceibacterota bacterium]
YKPNSSLENYEVRIFDPPSGYGYEVIIKADNMNIVGMQINNITVTNLSDGLFRLTTNESSNEVSRAQIIKTLFYGTDGSNPRATSTYITNPTIVYSNDIRDNNKQAYYANITQTQVALGGTYEEILVGNFTNTTGNTYCSSWSNVFVSISSGGGSGNSGSTQFEIPSGTTRNSASRGADGTTSINEIGTDTSADQVNNPFNVTLYGATSDTIAPLHSIISKTSAIVFCVGNVSWYEKDTDGDYNLTDFTNNKSFPIFQYLKSTTTLNSPAEDNLSSVATINFNVTSLANGFETLENMSLWTN